MQVCMTCVANQYSAEGAGICIQCPVFSAASVDKTECGEMGFRNFLWYSVVLCGSLIVFFDSMTEIILL